MGLCTYGMLHFSETSKLPAGYIVDNVVATVNGRICDNVYRTNRTKADLEQQLARFIAWEKVIDGGLFPYCDPSHWKCSANWCGYYKMCPGGGNK